MTEIKLTKQCDDIRGRVLRISVREDKIHLIEIKSGYARGGHSHPYKVILFIISGKVEYKEQVDKRSEIVKVIKSPEIITIPANHPHLVVAIKDSLIAEVFTESYAATEFPFYASVIDQKIKNRG